MSRFSSILFFILLITSSCTSETKTISQAEKGITPFDNRFKKMFESAGDPKFVNDIKKREPLVANIVAGFSAALGVKRFMYFMGDSNKPVDKVYLTGATWPSEVNDFRLQNEDTKFDYNSSDIHNINEVALKNNYEIVTTEKDFMKINKFKNFKVKFTKVDLYINKYSNFKKFLLNHL